MEKPSRKLPTKVSFAPIDSDAIQNNDNAYSDEEINVCWYTPNEIRLIELEIRNTVKLIEMANILGCSHRRFDSDIVCTRGLEHMASTSKTDKRIQHAIDAVLDQQEIQQQSNNQPLNQNKIADAYAKKTRRSNELARTIGFQDQELVIAMTKLPKSDDSGELSLSSTGLKETSLSSNGEGNDHIATHRYGNEQKQRQHSVSSRAA